MLGKRHNAVFKLEKLRLNLGCLHSGVEVRKSCIIRTCPLETISELQLLSHVKEPQEFILKLNLLLEMVEGATTGINFFGYATFHADCPYFPRFSGDSFLMN